MNKIRKITLLALPTLLLVGSSCSKDFLEKEPTNLITEQQIQKNSVWNPDILLGQIAGATKVLYSSQQAVSVHGEFGIKALDIENDILSGDMELINNRYSHFSGPAQLISTRITSLLYSYAGWRVGFKAVFAANKTIKSLGVDDITAPTDGAQRQAIWGQAKILRGLSYFYLLNHFTGSYEVDKDKEILPIARVGEEVSQPAAKTSEVYQFAIDDIKAGIAALDAAQVARSAKSDIDASVGYSYLAYLYLQKGDYAAAYQAAKTVIDANQYTLLPYSEVTTTGFNNVDNPEFIFGVDITTEIRTNLSSFFGHMDVFTYSYASAGDAKVINEELQAQIPASDIRHQWFAPVSTASFAGYPIGKFYTAKRPALDYSTVTADWIQGRKDLDKEWLSDVHFMRLSELYLVAAEAAARNGQLPEAKELLKNLLKERIEASAYPAKVAEIDGLSQADLLEQLYYNWRVEMWGEGRGLITMRRFKKNVARSSRSKFYPGVTIAYDDARLVHERPEREVSNNPYF